MRTTDFSWKDSNLGPQELSAVVNFTRPSLSPNISQPRGFSKGLKGLFKRHRLVSAASKSRHPPRRFKPTDLESVVMQNGSKSTAKPKLI